jgi:hypothetical protein
MSVAGAVVVAATIAATVAAAPTAAPRCGTSGLVIWLDTNGNGAAGSIYYKLEFTNQSGRRCTLSGYPGVSAISLTGRRLGSPGGRNPQHPARTVSLAPGATAVGTLQITEAGNYPPSACRSKAAAGLLVYPPNQTASKIVPFPFQACSKKGPVILHVEAVQNS